MKRQQKPAPVADLGIVSEAKAAAIPDGLEGQIDQGVSDIADQIDAHARAIVALDLDQGRAS